VGVMPAYPTLSQRFTSIGQHSLSSMKNANKFRINSNKLEQAVSKVS